MISRKSYITDTCQQWNLGEKIVLFDIFSALFKQLFNKLPISVSVET